MSPSRTKPRFGKGTHQYETCWPDRHHRHRRLRPQLHCPVPSPTGRKIRSATNRPIRFAEAYNGGPSTAYDLTAGEFDLNDSDKNKSAGVLYPAAQLIMRANVRNASGSELRARFDALTKRELEVLGHVVLGRLNKQIAADLCIHERTVKLHRTAITTKLRMQSVAELTRLTDEAGLFAASKPTFP
jgi:DNA-binding CsgD family transcriptional regulator